MANQPKVSSAYSVTVASSNPESPDRRQETKLAPPFPSPLGHSFPPPPVIQPNQIPLPSGRISSLNTAIQTNFIPSPYVRTPSPTSVTQPNQIPLPYVRTPSPTSVSLVNGIRDGSPHPFLSTPPGPPRFSSPLQPVALPFRTSNATSQSLPFTSGSSLPTSSSPSPRYSNSSVDLQDQVSEASEDLLPIIEVTNVLFSASKVPLSIFIQHESVY